MVSHTQSSIPTRCGPIRSNVSTSYKSASTTSTGRGSCDFGQVNPRKHTCNSSGPATSQCTSATSEVEEPTEKDECRPVWPATPFCYYNPSSRHTSQPGTSLLATASVISKLQIKPPPVTISIGNRNGSYKFKQPCPDPKHASGTHRHCMEDLHY